MFLAMTTNYMNKFTINEILSLAFTFKMNILACIYFNDFVVNTVRFLYIAFSWILSHPSSVIAFVCMCADLTVSWHTKDKIYNPWHGLQIPTKYNPWWFLATWELALCGDSTISGAEYVWFPFSRLLFTHAPWQVHKPNWCFRFPP